MPVLSIYGMCVCRHDMYGRYVFMSSLINLVRGLVMNYKEVMQISLQQDDLATH